MFLNRFHFSRETLITLFKIAIPMVISQGTFAVMIFTDRYFLSQISPTHMAAALGGGVACFFSFCFFSGVLSYGNAITAQYLGSGDRGRCPKVVSQGFIIILMSVPALALITFLVSGIFNTMGHAPEQVALEKSYYILLMAGSVITLAKICLASYFAGIAETRVIMISDVLGLILNVPLCYAMVFGKLGLPALGIEGAALSTIIATSFSLLLFLAFYWRRGHREKFSVADSFHYDKAILKRYLRLGLPSGVELFLNVAAFNLFLLMFQSYGVVQGAAAAIVFNWDMLSFIPMTGVNIAVISLIGRFVGSDDMKKANEVITVSFILAIGYSAALALSFIVFRFPMVDLFAPPGGDFEEIRLLSAFMMIGLATYTMGDATIQVCGGVLRGAGDTRWLMYASTSLHWIMLLAQYLIIRVLDYGPKASWIAFVLMILSIAFVFLSRLIGGRWRDPETLKLVMAE